MEYEQGKIMVETHCCSQCNAPLTLIWKGDTDEHALVCGNDHGHQGYKRLVSIGKTLARGDADKALGPGAQKDLERVLAKAPDALSRLPDKDLGSGKLLPLEQVATLVKWGGALGLLPYLGHVCLYFGKPYVTIDGYYYLLLKKGTDIRVGTRPLSHNEMEEYNIPAGSHAWLAESWLGSTKLPTTGLGIVTQDEIEGKSERDPSQWRSPVVHGHPQRMAEKRAEWQLLRKLVPLGEE